MKVRTASLTELVPPKMPKISARDLAAQKRQAELERLFARADKDPKLILAIEPEGTEKVATLRLALTKAMAAAAWTGNLRQKGDVLYISRTELPRTRAR